MAKKFLTPIDMGTLEILNLRLQNLGTDPASPVEGQVWINTAVAGAGVIKFYDGTTKQTLGTSSAAGTVTTVSVATANGFAGTVASATTTPVITVTTSVTGLLKGNGTAISAAAGSDLPALDTITAPAANLSLNSHKITNLLDGTAATDAATWGQVSLLVQGLTPKPTAAVATTANLTGFTYANGTSGVGATLTGAGNGTLVIDGYTTALGDRVLVKNQTSGFQNGLYDVTTAGAAGATAVLTRNVDMDTTAEFVGAFVVVENPGTANANSLWICSNTAAPTVGTTAITFTQLNGATDLVQGTGITISGNTVSVSASYGGQTSITTLGTITAGTWTGTSIAVANGGTGAATAAGARTNLNATGVYTALIGDGSTTAIAITQGTHGLASTGAILAACRDASTGAQVEPDITVNNANGTVTFTFATAPASNAYRVTLVG